MKYLWLLLILSSVFSCKDLLNTELIIINKTEEQCSEIYLKKTDEVYWGENLISTELEPDDDIIITLDKKTYDCRFLFSNIGYLEYSDIDLSLNDIYELQIWNRN